MSSNFEALYGEEVYANLIIECENRQFKVHKVVICTASSIIAKMFDPRNNMKESTSNVIKHEQFDAAILQRMIEFAYRGAYTVEVVRPHDSMSNDEGYTNEHADTQPVKVLPRDIKDFSASRLRLLVAHAYAYAIADYYEFVAMKVTAEDSSLDTMPYGWDASEPARLLELIVTIAQITAQGDKKGIRHETVDFTVHMLRHLKDDATFFSALVNSEEPAVQVLAKEIFQWSASRFQSCHDDKAYWCKREKKARQNNIKLREELKSNGLQHIKNINDLRAQKDKEMADAVTGVSAVFTKQIAEVERVEFESDARANEDANKLRQLAEKLRATRKDLDKLSSFIEDLPETCSNRKCSSKPLLFDIQRKRKYGRGRIEVRCRDCKARLKVKREKRSHASNRGQNGTWGVCSVPLTEPIYVKECCSTCRKDPRVEMRTHGGPCFLVALMRLAANIPTDRSSTSTPSKL